MASASTVELPDKAEAERLSATLLCLCAFCSTAGMLFGFDTGVVSGTLLKVADQFQLSTVQQEWFVSCTTLSAAFAALLCASSNAMFGRRPLLHTAGLLYLVGSITVASAQSYAQLIGGRMMLGLAIGFTSTTVPMFAAELAPRSMRGKIISMHTLSIVLGQCVSGILNGALFHINHGWRYSFALAALAAVGLIVTLYPLPESPRWLLRVGRAGEAEESLVRIAGGSLFALKGAPKTEAVAAELASLREAVALEEAEEHTSGGLHALWTEAPLRRAALLGLLLMSLQQCAPPRLP